MSARNVISEAVWIQRSINPATPADNYLPDADGILTYLADSGFAVVKLPEPDSLDVFDKPKWFDTGWDIGVPLSPPNLPPEVRIEASRFIKPDQARLLAAALLAAATTAEVNS